MRIRIPEAVSTERLMQLQRALQRWENEGGAGLRHVRTSPVDSRHDLDSNRRSEIHGTSRRLSRD